MPTPASPTTVTSRQPSADASNSASSTCELFAAADERRAGLSRQLPVRAHLEQPESSQGLGLALRRDRRDRLDLDGVPHQPVGLLAEQHLARGGRLLEPGGDVDRVAEHDRVARGEHLAPRRVAGDDLAGVHPDPDRDPGPSVRRHPLLDLERRPASAQRVVLVRLGHAEHPDDRVADELLDRAAVPLERRHARRRSTSASARTPISASGRSAIAVDPDRSQNTDVTSLRRSTAGAQRRTAGTTEPVASRVLEPAISADQHGRFSRVTHYPVPEEWSCRMFTRRVLRRCRCRCRCLSRPGRWCSTTRRRTGWPRAGSRRSSWRP